MFGSQEQLVVHECQRPQLSLTQALGTDAAAQVSDAVRATSMSTGASSVLAPSSATFTEAVAAVEIAWHVVYEALRESGEGQVPSEVIVQLRAAEQLLRRASFAHRAWAMQHAVGALSQLSGLTDSADIGESAVGTVCELGFARASLGESAHARAAVAHLPTGTACVVSAEVVPGLELAGSFQADASGATEICEMATELLTFFAQGLTPIVHRTAMLARLDELKQEAVSGLELQGARLSAQDRPSPLKAVPPLTREP